MINPTLSAYELSELREALSYMHIAELKEELRFLRINALQAHNKKELIDRIMHFIQTGKELEVRIIPPISRAIKGIDYILAPNTLMLYGAYKNDLPTRLFFKKLIGNHFHFTAYGIDWLRERWLQGNPPTYQEFADEWQNVNQSQQQQKRAPKQEWAYICFTQQYVIQHPTASSYEIAKAWEGVRTTMVNKAQTLLRTIFK